MQNYRKSYYYFKLTADIVILVFCFFVSSYLANHRIIPGVSFFRPEKREIFFCLLLCLIWYFSSRFTGLYDEFRSRNLVFEILSVFKNSLIQLFAAAVIIFILKTIFLSRFFSATYFLSQLLFLSLWKIGLRVLLRWVRKKGYNLRFMLIVGAGEIGQMFARLITDDPYLGYRIVGFLDDMPNLNLGEAYLGPISELETVLNTKLVDEVVVALPDRAVGHIRHVMVVCGNHTARVRIIPDYFEFISNRFSVSIFGNFPLISIRNNPLEEVHWRLVKRVFDLVFSVFLFVLVFPWLWPLIALAIKFSSPGPILFRQERWGRNNKRIRCFKFRTMVRESQDVDENGNYLQASKDDPRITPVGRFLRRTNLDELPQFLNVIQGNMSVVGPRPHPTPLNLEAMNAIDRYTLRHLVKPGITGWAQINGFRGETKNIELMKKRVEHDLWYIENWTFWLDIQIGFLTAWRMLKGDIHAY